MQLGGATAVGVGLAAGALTYFLADRALPKDDEGAALTLGAFLDGIPEQLVLGIGLAAGDGVSVGLLAAIFVSNLPEAIGSASGLHAPPRKIIALWVAVAAICTLATVAGFALADNVSRRAPGRRQRLRRGRAARDADRLDDPRGAAQGRERRRAGHRARIRRRRGPDRYRLTQWSA